MPSLPGGTLTFLFTDIEGSTRLVQELGAGFRDVLETHHGILRRAIAAHHGVEVSTEGDAFFAVFPSALDAVSATVDAQRELASSAWPGALEIRVRMGLHTGDAELGGDNYVGVDVHRAARIAAAGHGGQVLLSASTRALVEPALPDQVLLRDLGMHQLKDLPSPEHLHQLVIAGLPADFPALKTLDASPTNLVAPATPIVGRDRELAELSDLLAANRLLTLTGPGGTGKTRLAVEVGGRARGHFSDGVFFVPLETFTERSVVASAVAQAIGARVPGQHDPEDVLADHLARRQLFLILDNFEQVTSAAPLVARLISSTARMRVLVTTRVPLHLNGEQEYPVPPLAIPDAETGADIDALSRVEAVALFVERARRVQPTFQLTTANADAVAAICRRLDGLPLAIELASAQVKMLAPGAILARLEQALPFLGGGSVDQPARQRTLRAAIEWSYLLLDDPEQTVFRRLTVFSGGWTFEAAEQVTGPAGGAHVDVLGGLTALVDQSLVRPAVDAPPDEPRFEMLQMIREYGAGRLAETEEGATLGRRHAEWALVLVKAAEPTLEGGTDPGWLDRLSREHDNLRAALRWAVDHDERDFGLRLATALWRFWQLRGHIQEGRQWFDRLMPAVGDEGTVDPSVLAPAHTAAGGLAYWQNAMADANEHYRSALKLDRLHDRRDRLGDDLYNLGFVAMVAGDLAAARSLFLESTDLFVAAGQSARLADTTAARGAVEMRAGNLDQARRLMEEGRRLNLEGGNHLRATDNAMVLSNIHLSLGEAAAAHQWLLTALADTTEVGDVARWPLLLDMGMAIALADRRPDNALRFAAAAAKRRAAMGGGINSNLLQNVDQVVADARAALQERDGAKAVDEAWAEGERLDEKALAALLRGASQADADIAP
ncbi:MAG: adenylate/guanylate cyclase domain-containing protein [Chloroflexota bacterium]|nr:adenylate/guanylate cyclase domain-containing protein [Chloroflexota bacterium]